MVEKIASVLNRPLPKSPLFNVSDSDQNAYQKHITDSDQNPYQKHITDSDIASCIMLASMTTELHMQHETMEALI